MNLYDFEKLIPIFIFLNTHKIVIMKKMDTARQEYYVNCRRLDFVNERVQIAKLTDERLLNDVRVVEAWRSFHFKVELIRMCIILLVEVKR